VTKENSGLKHLPMIQGENYYDFIHLKKNCFCYKTQGMLSIQITLKNLKLQ